jgi:hypothetical protein
VGSGAIGLTGLGGRGALTTGGGTGGVVVGAGAAIDGIDGADGGVTDCGLSIREGLERGAGAGVTTRGAAGRSLGSASGLVATTPSRADAGDLGTTEGGAPAGAPPSFGLATAGGVLVTAGGVVTAGGALVTVGGATGASVGAFVSARLALVGSLAGAGSLGVTGDGLDDRAAIGAGASWRAGA